MYLTHKLLSVGITANTPLAAVRQAMLIGSANAIQTAINCSITGIAWYLDHLDHSCGSSSYKDLKRQAIRAFLEYPEVKSALFRLKQLYHEGV